MGDTPKERKRSNRSFPSWVTATTTCTSCKSCNIMKNPELFYSTERMRWFRTCLRCLHKSKQRRTGRSMEERAGEAADEMGPLRSKDLTEDITTRKTEETLDDTSHISKTASTINMPLHPMPMPLPHHSITTYPPHLPEPPSHKDDRSDWWISRTIPVTGPPRVYPQGGLVPYDMQAHRDPNPYVARPPPPYYAYPPPWTMPVEYPRPPEPLRLKEYRDAHGNILTSRSLTLAQYTPPPLNLFEHTAHVKRADTLLPPPPTNPKLKNSSKKNLNQQPLQREPIPL